MKSKQWLLGLLAATFALSLAGADIAAAYCGGGICGRGNGSGPGVCRVEGGRDNCPSYQKGQGPKKGHGRQQCLRPNNCPVNPDRATQAAQPASPSTN
jgi:hypothetical protein